MDVMILMLFNLGEGGGGGGLYTFISEPFGGYLKRQWQQYLLLQTHHSAGQFQFSQVPFLHEPNPFHARARSHLSRRKLPFMMPATAATAILQGGNRVFVSFCSFSSMAIRACSVWISSSFFRISSRTISRPFLHTLSYAVTVQV